MTINQNDVLSASVELKATLAPIGSEFFGWLCPLFSSPPFPVVLMCALFYGLPVFMPVAVTVNVAVPQSDCGNEVRISFLLFIVARSTGKIP